MLASDFEIMWQQYQYSLNELAGEWHCISRVLHLAAEIDRHPFFSLRHIWSRTLSLDGACCIRVEQAGRAKVTPIVWLSDTREDVFAACIAIGSGRIVALADVAPFTNTMV